MLGSTATGGQCPSPSSRPGSRRGRQPVRGRARYFSATCYCSHTSLNARRTCLMHGSANRGRRSSGTRGDRVPHTGDNNVDPGGHNEAMTDPDRCTDGRAGKDGLQYIGAAGFPALPPVQAGLERGRQDQAPSAPVSMTQLVGPPGGVYTGLRRRRRRRRRRRGPDRRPEVRRDERQDGRRGGQREGRRHRQRRRQRFRRNGGGKIDGLHALRSAGGCTRVLQPLHPACGCVHRYCDGDGFGDDDSDGQMDSETP